MSAGSTATAGAGPNSAATATAGAAPDPAAIATADTGRIAVGLSYDGSGFSGWQVQPAARSVQGVLEAALATIAGQALRVRCAGRTDAGVHALAQVVHFDSPVRRPLSAWVRGVNSALPDDVSVHWAREVPARFDARYSATQRHYRYVLIESPVRPALWRHHAGWVFRPVDVAAMQRAAQYLKGEHDFSAFRSAQCQARSPLRQLAHASVTRSEERIDFEFRANAFLHHMVRNMVGALLEVGLGRRDPSWVAELLAGRDRRLGAPTFAAQGLYLAGVDYPAEFGLPATPAPAPAFTTGRSRAGRARQDPRCAR